MRYDLVEGTYAYMYFYIDKYKNVQLEIYIQIFMRIYL